MLVVPKLPTKDPQTVKKKPGPKHIQQVIPSYEAQLSTFYIHIAEIPEQFFAFLTKPAIIYDMLLTQ
jgi:hypothetical protein